jgi:hypothetical protein
MVERPAEPDHDAYVPESKPRAEDEIDLPDTPPTITTDDAYDATWTERMLNSLVAWGRRDRALVRHAHSDARSYVAYSARARLIPAAPKGTVDRGTVELEPSDDAHRALHALRAQYAASTVVVHPKRFSWWWVVLAVCATGGLCLIGTNRDSKTTTTSRGDATNSSHTLPAETSPPLVPAPAPTEPVAVPASPAATASPERHSFVDPPRRQPRAQAHQSTTHGTPPASSSLGKAHREFLDVVNQY